MICKKLLLVTFVSIAAFSKLAIAGGKTGESPEAASRTYAQNYRDMALAACLAKAYQQDRSTLADVSSSFSALRDWTYYDMENAPDKMQKLIEKYLRRDYHNPLVAAETKEDIKFNFLKCLDMYHSKELADQIKLLIPKPNRTYRQEYPNKR